MPLFSYKAKNIQGETIKGTVEAIHVDAASDLLRDRQLIVLSLQQRSQISLNNKITRILNRVTPKDLTFFARQLSVMIEASVPVVRSLRILTKQTKNVYFQTVITDIALEVDGGAKLSQAMNRYSSVFNPFFVHMIRSGETTGRLDQVLQYLADQTEKDYNLRSRIKGAMMYPAFILLTMVGIGAIMMVYVVPRLVDIITEGGGQLPITTRILIGTSGFIVNFWWLIILLIILLSVGLFFYTRSSQGKFYVDLLKIKIPIFGPLYQRILLTRFSMSLSNLLASGVPITRSLEISGDVVNNEVYHDLIRKTIIEVESGNSIATVFNKSEKIVPPIVGQMMSIGEETGKIDEILQKLAKFYTQEVENAITSLTSLIEPLILITLGVGAGIMVAGILTPLYNITETVG